MNDQGKVDEAEGFYKRAISLQPRNADAYNNYAVFLGKMGENWHKLLVFPSGIKNPQIEIQIPTLSWDTSQGSIFGLSSLVEQFLRMSWAKFLFVLWLEVVIFFRLEARNFQLYTESRNWGGRIQKVNKWSYTYHGRAVKKTMKPIRSSNEVGYQLKELSIIIQTHYSGRHIQI